MTEETPPPASPEACATRATRLAGRFGRIVGGLGYAKGLNPAQWDALRYLGMANRYSRTPGALTAFLGCTRGTVSQTLKSLETRGLIHKQRATCDGRSVWLEVTPAGREVLESDPACVIRQAIARSGLGDERAADLLEALVRGLVETCDLKTFGPCHDCGHLREGGQPGDDGLPAAAGPCCGLNGDRLAARDMSGLCVNFAGPATPPDPTPEAGEPG